MEPVDILSKKYSTFSSAVTEILSFSQTVRRSDRHRSTLYYRIGISPNEIILENTEQPLQRELF